MVDHIKVPHAWRSTELVVLTGNKPTNEERNREKRGGFWRGRTGTRFLFNFGAYGCTWVLVYSDSLEDALEDAAEYLADHAPGHIVAHDSSELRELYTEALEELKTEAEAAGVTFDPEDEDTIAEAEERATAGLTYTESGYLTSHEWGCSCDPSRGELLELLGREDEARHWETMRRGAVALERVRKAADHG